MRTLSYPREVRAMALLLALQAAGVPVRAVRPETGPSVVVEVEDAANDATVAAVVAAHDAAALDAAEATAQANFLGDVSLLRAYHGAASPTNAQSVAAIKALIRTMRRVVRELND